MLWFSFFNFFREIDITVQILILFQLDVSSKIVVENVENSRTPLRWYSTIFSSSLTKAYPIYDGNCREIANERCDSHYRYREGTLTWKWLINGIEEEIWFVEFYLKFG